MTTVQNAVPLVDRLAAEFDVLPVALVRRCVEAVTPTGRRAGPGEVEDSARRDLAGLAEALQRRTATGR